MMIRLFLISSFIATACLANGQTVIVNPDGTHTIVTGSVIVHPNGQHSIIQTTGVNTVVVGPDGRHTIMVGTDKPGSPKIIIHPDGRHSVVHSTATTSIMVGPDGTHTVAIHQLSSLLQANIFLHLIGF